MERTTLHIVGGESRSRAEQARIAFALGHHAEVYSDTEELLERPPGQGIVIVTDDGSEGATAGLLNRSAERGLWLPVVMASPNPAIERVVDAIRAGALDYLALPFEMNSFARRLRWIQGEAAQYVERRRTQVLARIALDTLSPREHEVLHFLSEGFSNKEIARALAISPRTVEIHRGNMMTKLGARHVAQAVRLWLEVEAGQQGEAVREPIAEAGTYLLRPLSANSGSAIAARAGGGRR